MVGACGCPPRFVSGLPARLPLLPLTLAPAVYAEQVRHCTMEQGPEETDDVMAELDVDQSSGISILEFASWWAWKGLLR